ncbi:MULTISPECIES: tRNA (guanosine(37)-N1)-methyltransferase TrmD [Lactobacillus]|uniref:tRNA (guanine-N(1)-)-methyltransferase n=1 Tax=Lactobacillus melliventris TaxID=1218507 RepID=A0A0F4LGR6_9LACO|nr:MULTISPECIES: tRNA (guanosine(37)-N1)-methyltransferase TrmD [Lactobacillus]KJY56771.1 tRNA (guanine-N(1)-)-methyltransferase [Lactobacillus melliventris]MBC6350320.1 tRNA (guanosine(37)-N1)-methyltransferase TrmD [Lactobacillus melliventris]MBH9989614.1 tRNA (guanosine(37)-N1)-methyltransferase TrmD [Lactobacillus sp. M0392]MBI0023317.1 tRNA (guanosine(37)-N1)-methyltransferase TrmD [Lactobacillus sp. W8171]MBI0044563.1 tRNA (guanosine(37)-N1)-methyltransferase TrmD [Lactobacillus sp. M039
MKINVLTLFPDMFTPLTTSMLGRGLDDGKWQLNLVNFRDFTTDIHHHVDDSPYGGGAGMVLQIMPIKKALDSIKNKGKVIITAPQGKTFNQKMAQDWSQAENLTFICGHYEGFDQRVYDLADEIVSIGDYVLTGGELPTMSMIDATVRLIPGILGNDASPVEESFAHGLLEYPQYTRPENFQGMKVPAVLTSGNHQKIAQWRHKEALRATYLRRPDLLEQHALSAEEEKMLAEIKQEEDQT